MRISLRANDTTYPLAGASGVGERTHSSAGDFSIVGEPVIQEVRKVRADYAEVIDRGNLLQRITFSTSRLFATSAEAELWCLDYDATDPRSGDLWLDAIAPDGAITRRVMAGCVVQPPRRRTIGCTALIDYEAIGGAIAPLPSMIVSGVTTPTAMNGTLPPAPQFMGYDAWSSDGAAVDVLAANKKVIFWNGGVWNVMRVDSGGVDADYLYRKSSTAASPAGLTGWTQFIGTGAPTLTQA